MKKDHEFISLKRPNIVLNLLKQKPITYDCSITSSSKESYSLSQPQLVEIDMMQYLHINFPDQQ